MRYEEVERLRSVITEYYINGLDWRGVAAMVNMHYKTCQSYRNRAINKIMCYSDSRARSKD